MSAIFYHDEDQRRLAQESNRREEARLGVPILTEIAPLRAFHLAEDYHQKYYLRHEPELMQRLGATYPGARAFTDSTAAARLNGYAGGYGTPEGLESAQEELGLSAAAADRLIELAARGLQAGCAIPRG
jgi:peptide-methionine (S)-S-oxide reductase